MTALKRLYKDKMTVIRFVDKKVGNFARPGEDEVLKETSEPKCPYCGAILIGNLKVCKSCKTRIVKDNET